MKNSAWITIFALSVFVGSEAQEPPSPPPVPLVPTDAEIKSLRALQGLKVGDRTAIGDVKVKMVGTLTEANIIPNAFLGGMMFKVFLWIDQKQIATFGGNTKEDVKALLKMIAVRYGPASIPGGQKATVRVAIWDPVQEAWFHPGNLIRPADWDGFLDVELKAHVGSWQE